MAKLKSKLIKNPGVIIPRVTNEYCKSKIKNAGSINLKESKTCIHNLQNYLFHSQRTRTTPVVQSSVLLLEVRNVATGEDGKYKQLPY